MEKGLLNEAVNDRPHQGCVLCASKLQFASLDGWSAPEPGAGWLALDEIVDPQNLGSFVGRRGSSGFCFSERQKLGALECGGVQGVGGRYRGGAGLRRAEFASSTGRREGAGLARPRRGRGRATACPYQLWILHNRRSWSSEVRARACGRP